MTLKKEIRKSVLLSEIKINDKNPRTINQTNFKKLCKSITDFPKMMNLRPIIIDVNNVIIGGNMRYKALIELGYKEVSSNWVKRADELTNEERQRFIIADNIEFGDWDMDILVNDWDSFELEAWGIELPTYESGDIVELPNITTTFNINIKCDTPHDFEAMKIKLGITSNSIHSSMLKGLLA